MIRTTTSSKSDLHFAYDAMGNRVCKIVKPRAGSGILGQENWTYTYYERDAQGNILATYDRIFRSITGGFTEKYNLKENDLYGSSRTGIRNTSLEVAAVNLTTSGHNSDQTLNVTAVSAGSGTALSTTIFNHKLGEKSYELVNHLGNVLVTVSDMRTANHASTTVTGFNAVVNSATDYYSFGSAQEGRSYTSTSYRYSFNGKEKDDETGTQDYGMRIYNPGLGRFLSVDPLKASYPYYSPYHFAGNSPLSCIDVDGQEPSYVPSKCTHSGNLMIILMDSPSTILSAERQSELGLSNWDYVCVNSLEEADTWVHNNYADGTVNNLVIQTHSTDCGADGNALCAKDATGNLDVKADKIHVSAKDFQIANVTQPNDCDTKEVKSARAIGNIGSVLANNANVLFTGCGMGNFEDLDRAIYVEMQGQNKSLNMYFDKGTTELYYNPAATPPTEGPVMNERLSDQWNRQGWRKMGVCDISDTGSSCTPDVYDMQLNSRGKPIQEMPAPVTTPQN